MKSWIGILLVIGLIVAFPFAAKAAEEAAAPVAEAAEEAAE